MKESSEPQVRVPVQGVCYQVRNRADKRQRLAILSQVSAYFNPSEMAAVMGPSGSGAPALCAHATCRPTSDSAASPAVRSHWHSRCAAAPTGSTSSSSCGHCSSSRQARPQVGGVQLQGARQGWVTNGNTAVRASGRSWQVHESVSHSRASASCGWSWRMRRGCGAAQARARCWTWWRAGALP